MDDKDTSQGNWPWETFWSQEADSLAQSRADTGCWPPESSLCPGGGVPPDWAKQQLHSTLPLSSVSSSRVAENIASPSSTENPQIFESSFLQLEFSLSRLNFFDSFALLHMGLSVSQWFSACGCDPFGDWMTLSQGVAYQIFCISDIYMTIHNSCKITVMK